MNVSFFQHLFSKLSHGSRQFFDLSFAGITEPKTIENLCQTLLASKGEASSVELARRILDLYALFEENQKSTFFETLARDFCVNRQAITLAAQDFLKNQSSKTLDNLSKTLESPFRELLKRLNMAPLGTVALVKMREDLLKRAADKPEFQELDRDFRALFDSWFNRGFLVLESISWSTPANILEKIIEYEAVHAMQGWEDLRRRLNPKDRRCFAFFHPAMGDEPLIFVEVALERDAPSSIGAVLEAGALDSEDDQLEPTVAIFYSISNCQPGLRGISFGNFLIKQVVEDLTAEIPSLRSFVTLSPVPGFAVWLHGELAKGALTYFDGDQLALLEEMKAEGFTQNEASQDALRPLIMAAAAHYFLLAKDEKGKPLDQVARFHLGNGARLDRINWLADTSTNGIKQSLSLMVNYRYELKEIERNHEAYSNQGSVIASKAVRGLLLAPEKSRELAVIKE